MAIVLNVLNSPATAGNTKNEDLTNSLITAERFIDAFYAFNHHRLATMLTDADTTAVDILRYQGWAQGGNYQVIERGRCRADSDTGVITCAITVKDDHVQALQTGFNVTDSFHLTFMDEKLVNVTTSSNDQPVYYEARRWVKVQMPEIYAGPCNQEHDTPQACAQAITEGFKLFHDTILKDR